MRHDNAPIEASAGLRGGGLAHAAAQGRVADKRGISGRRRAGIHRDQLAREADVMVVIVDLEIVAVGQFHTVWRRGHQRRHPKPVDAVPHRVPIPVPVGDHGRQAGGHALDRAQAKGLLQIIRQRRVDIRSLPDAVAHIRVAAIEKMADDIGAVRLGAVAKGALDRIVGEPAALDQVQPGAWRQRVLRQRLLQSAIHRHGVSLAVKAEPAEEQDGDILIADAQPLAPRHAHRRHRYIGVAIDAERDDR